MSDLTFSDMQKMQYQLWEKNKEQWSPLEPEQARNHFLWMIGEVGEALEIVKKSGEVNIMSDPAVKSAFVEEMCDVLMYFNDILMRYKVEPEDIADIYVKKFNKNMGRNFAIEEQAFTDHFKDEGAGE